METGGKVGQRIYSTGPGVFVSTNLRNLEHAKTVLRRYSEYFDTKTLKLVQQIPLSEEIVGVDGPWGGDG